MIAHIAEVKNHGLHSKRDWSYDIPSQIMTKIENNLPSRCQNIFTAWSSVPNEHTNIAPLTSWLLKEESMVKRWNEDDNIARDAALLAKDMALSSNSRISTTKFSKKVSMDHEEGRVVFPQSMNVKVKNKVTEANLDTLRSSAEREFEEALSKRKTIAIKKYNSSLATYQR